MSKRPPHPPRATYALPPGSDLTALGPAYAAGRPSDRRETPRLGDCQLVASHLPDDLTRHAPLFDIDHTCSVTADPDTGLPVLWVDGLDRASWEQVREVLERNGVAAPVPSGFDPASPPRERGRVMASQEPRSDELVTALLQQFGPGWDGGLGDLLSLTDALVCGTPPQLARQVVHDDPWPVTFNAPVLVVPSSTPGHFHWYVETTVTCDQMFDLLEGFACAGLVEHGYVGASRARGAAHLRLPWIRKAETAAVA